MGPAAAAAAAAAAFGRRVLVLPPDPEGEHGHEEEEDEVQSLEAEVGGQRAEFAQGLKTFLWRVFLRVINRFFEVLGEHFHTLDSSSGSATSFDLVLVSNLWAMTPARLLAGPRLASRRDLCSEASRRLKEAVSPRND